MWLVGVVARPLVEPAPGPHRRARSELRHGRGHAQPLADRRLTGAGRGDAGDRDELPVRSEAEGLLVHEVLEDGPKRGGDQALPSLGVLAVGGDVDRVVAHAAREEIDGLRHVRPGEVDDLDTVG